MRLQLCGIVYLLTRSFTRLSVIHSRVVTGNLTLEVRVVLFGVFFLREYLYKIRNGVLHVFLLIFFRCPKMGSVLSWIVSALVV